jgi:hypothetical protein
MILASRATTVERALYASPSETAWLPVIHSVAADRGCAEEPLERALIRVAGLCCVGFLWTRRTCFLTSFGLTFLVPPFSAFRSLPLRCRLITFGTATDGNSSGICSSVASGSTELMEVTGKRSLFVSVSITGPVPTSGMSLLAVTDA